MPMHVRDAGSWKEVTAPSVRDGGTWKAVKGAWVKDSGAWKKFYSAVTVILTNLVITDAVDSGTAIAGIVFDSSGQLKKNEGGVLADISGEWLIPFTGSGYRVRATLSSGTTPTSGPALDAWHALSTTREWRNERAFEGDKASALFVEIDDGGGNVLGSATFTITASFASGL